MGGLQRQHNPWQGGQESMYRTPISAMMQPTIESRVAKLAGLQLGSFVLASEMIVPYTHRYAETEAAGLIWRLGARMKDVLREGQADFEMYCPGFAIANPEIPLTGTAIPRPALIAFSHDMSSEQKLIDATFEVLVMRTNNALPEGSSLQIPQ